MLNYNSVSFLATLIWCFSLLLHSQPSFSAPSNETDRLALLAIKSLLHDPLGVTSSWNNSVDFCRWTGVTCGGRHQRVTELDLNNKTIGGFLSPYVGNLSFLRFINLADNSFYGEIPHEVCHLFRLETLVLGNNSFSGTIPSNLSCCSNLISFHAYSNNLGGEFPAYISNMWSKLEILSIYTNKLTGQLPHSFGNLSALQIIDVGDNRLHGRIPQSLGQLRNLFFLNFGLNQFSGMVPPSIYNSSSLEIFYIHLNRLSGSLPVELGVKLPNLREFVISGNYFSGSIPDSLSNASNLEVLNLLRNQFKGEVSINFSSLKNLSTLNLGSNNLGTSLDFVTLLTNCSKLKKLLLDENRFGGVMPHSIANLSTTLTHFLIGRNQIFGTIPPGIRNLVSLGQLSMDNNQLHGTIPHVIGELKNLQILHLGGNLLQGSIPFSLGNLTILSKLVLEFNNLQGHIPSSLGHCQNLIVLNLSQNNLTGALPQQILSIMTLSVSLDLSNNLLNGSLPLEVGNLKNLIAFDVSGNQFSGEIPSTLSACTSLAELMMQRNSFTGSIPLSLSSLKSIKKLDLSHNNLSGNIPKFLESLSFLEYLNLSYNHLEGEVPIKGVFQDKTNFSLVANGKLCGGSKELHFPSCQSKGSRKPAVYLKVVIPVILSYLILSACFIIVYARKRFAHKSSTGLQIEQHFPMVSYSELSKATNEFSSSNIIGQGSFGFVYKGVLGDNGMTAAIKVLNLMQKSASKSFLAECDALRNIRHRNLIKIITVCSSVDFKGVDFKALIYEYMQNGSLEEWLHKSTEQLEVCSLSLIQRLNIAIDVASAIEYLHHQCLPSIIHGDLKPSNILLDHEMVAHVSDFGLARFLYDSSLNANPQTQSSSIGIKGTVGYIAPEYGMGGEMSMPGDVYSFGILLLELFIRKRPTDSMFNDGLTLHEFVKMALPEKVMEIVEPSLTLEEMASNSRSHGDLKVRIELCFVAVIKTGILCSMESPMERMEMGDVVAKLCDARKTFLGRSN